MQDDQRYLVFSFYDKINVIFHCVMLFVCAHLPFPFSDKAVFDDEHWYNVGCRRWLKPKCNENYISSIRLQMFVCLVTEMKRHQSPEKPNTCLDNNKWHGFAHVTCLVVDWCWYLLPYPNVKYFSFDILMMIIIIIVSVIIIIGKLFSFRMIFNSTKSANSLKMRNWLQLWQKPQQPK